MPFITFVCMINQLDNFYLNKEEPSKSTLLVLKKNYSFIGQ